MSHTSAFAGVSEVVTRFDRLGLRQGVCTNKFERPSRMILEHLKLMPPIADLAGADTFPVRKPDPRHILMLVERMGGSPGRPQIEANSCASTSRSSKSCNSLISVLMRAPRVGR